LTSGCQLTAHVCFLQTLELLDCRALTLSGWPRDAVPLREVYLNGCNFFTNQAASSLIKGCGNTLEKVTFTGAQGCGYTPPNLLLMLVWFAFTEATSLDSQVFRDFARHSLKLEELTIRHADWFDATRTVVW
jgi:hypothetical protein